MKKITIILLASLFQSCYAMGGKSPKWRPEQERSFDNKIYWPCTEKQVAAAAGLFCNQVCEKVASGGNCQEVKINIIDPKKDHESLLKGGFVLAPSKFLFN